MKFFIVFALCVAAASARFIIPDVAAAEAAEIKEILAAIENPNTDPATAAALAQLLNDFLGIAESPIQVGPAIVPPGEVSPVAPGPVIVDEIEESPIQVDEAPIAPSPVIVQDSEESPIHVGPAIIDQQIPSSSPLVQVVINVNSGAPVAGSPVAVEGPQPTPVDVVESPVEIVEQPIINAPIFPTPVIVVESPEEIVEQPIINIPVFPSPVVAPDTLN